MKKIAGFLSAFSFLCLCTYAQENNFITEGIKMHDKGDYEGAITFFKKALQSDKNSIHANYEMASTYLAMKDYTNALQYADKVIARNLDYVDQAYILKGSALDLSGKPLQAINTYKLALKKYSKNQSLYYNLALTYFSLKQYNDADEALIRSLKLDQLHAGSHFLLGLSQARQGKRVKSLLVLYNFLLLEPKTKRSITAFQTLQDQWKNAGNKAAQVNNEEDDEFSTATAMLDVLQDANKNEANKNKPEYLLLGENTNIIFTILGEEKKDKKGFWWNFYVDYFYSLASNHHTEALCYYITQSANTAYNEWLKDNLKKMEALSEWYTKYLHKY
ncbi:MAG: tetratricopeptide repeat protein [Ferruginibacter sp.]|nr:tetratricopeptide repeat protein [Ferruginibacter sp.]